LQLALALTHLKSRRVFHMDLKPKNILHLRCRGGKDEPQFVVGDLGVAVTENQREVWKAPRRNTSRKPTLPCARSPQPTPRNHNPQRPNPESPKCSECRRTTCGPSDNESSVLY